MNTTRTLAAGGAALLLASAAFAALSKSDVKLLNEAARVVNDMHSGSDGAIPRKIWDDADCVVIVPSLKKAGFIVGGEFGDGVMSCRRRDAWSAPVFMELTKGSIGLPAGAQSVELVLLGMNQSGVDKLQRNKVTPGADASIAAGPVGRSASAATDAQMSAEM